MTSGASPSILSKGFFWFLSCFQREGFKEFKWFKWFKGSAPSYPSFLPADTGFSLVTNTICAATSSAVIRQEEMPRRL